jgi:anti-sigma factor RsiW
MKCDKLRGELMEAVLSGPEAISPEMQEHLRQCQECAREMGSLRQTMALLDDWQTPEPSPYFGSRLRAQLREEVAAESRGWLAWLRRPVVAAAAVMLIAIGAGLLETGHIGLDRNTLLANGSSSALHNVNAPGDAVSDLQYLDKNADLFSEFDALDSSSTTE